MRYIKAFWADKSNRVSLLLTVGLILFICHYENQPLLEYVPLFQVGLVILWFAVGFLIINRWKEIKETGLGPKYIWIPLAVIASSAILQVFIYRNPETVAGALFIVSMFGLYVVARKYGEKALNFFMPVVIIGAMSIIIQTMVMRSPNNVGIFNNYATASQFLVFGWIVSPRKHQWWMAILVVIALFYSGAPEAWFYIVGIGLFILIRKDWSKRFLIPVGMLGVVLLVTLFGVNQAVTQNGSNMLKLGYQAITDDSLTPEQRDEMLNEATHGRWLYTWRLQRPVQPLGYGVDIYNVIRTEDEDIHIPHNIVLLVSDQLGPIAACAWLFVMVAGIRKTKWKYGFLALILFGVFQPFVWTEMAPYMWCMAGAATTSVRSSYVFKEA